MSGLVVPDRPDTVYLRAHALAQKTLTGSATTGELFELGCHLGGIADYLGPKAQELAGPGPILFGHDLPPDDVAEYLAAAHEPIMVSGIFDGSFIRDFITRYVLTRLADPAILDQAARWLAPFVPRATAA